MGAFKSQSGLLPYGGGGGGGGGTLVSYFTPPPPPPCVDSVSNYSVVLAFLYFFIKVINFNF